MNEHYELPIYMIDLLNTANEVKHVMAFNFLKEHLSVRYCTYLQVQS